MSLQLTPYLNFNGTCEEAMNFYQKTLGGTVEITRFGDMPMPGQEESADNVMNAIFKAENITFMASDSGMGVVAMGDSVHLSLGGGIEESEKLHLYFDGLSEGGTVKMPLTPMPWGADFGMFTDKFGINWMVNIQNGIPAVM